MSALPGGRGWQTKSVQVCALFLGRRGHGDPPESEITPDKRERQQTFGSLLRFGSSPLQLILPREEKAKTGPNSSLQLFAGQIDDGWWGQGRGAGRWENKEQRTQAEEVWEVLHRGAAAALGQAGGNISIPGGFQGLAWQSHGQPALMMVTVLHGEKGLGISKVPLNQGLCGATGGKCKDLKATSSDAEGANALVPPAVRLGRKLGQEVA